MVVDYMIRKSECVIDDPGRCQRRRGYIANRDRELSRLTSTSTLVSRPHLSLTLSPSSLIILTLSSTHSLIAAQRLPTTSVGLGLSPAFLHIRARSRAVHQLLTMARQERHKPVEQEVIRRQSAATHQNIEEEEPVGQTAEMGEAGEPQETLTPELEPVTPALSVSDKEEEEESSTRASSLRRASTDVKTRFAPVRPARRDTTDSLASRQSSFKDVDRSSWSHLQLIAPVSSTSLDVRWMNTQTLHCR